jgi:hypothetical protein
MGFYRLIPDNELTDRQRYVANIETAKYSGKFIKFMGRVNCIEFDGVKVNWPEVDTIHGFEPVFVLDARYVYVHRLATRKLFFFCLYGEKMVCVQEDEMEYEFIIE